MTAETYRTRPTKVTAVQIPRSIDINPDRAPTREELRAAAHPILKLLGTPDLRSEHATVRLDGRVQVSVHQIGTKVYNGSGSDWLIRDEYGVFTIVDDRTFKAFYELESPAPGEEQTRTLVEALPVIQRVLADINGALAAAGTGYTIDFDVRPLIDLPGTDDVVQVVDRTGGGGGARRYRVVGRRPGPSGDKLLLEPES